MTTEQAPHSEPERREMPQYPSMAEEWVIAVRRSLGDGHERFTDDDIWQATRAFIRQPAPWSVARRLMALYRDVPNG